MVTRFYILFSLFCFFSCNNEKSPLDQIWDSAKYKSDLDVLVKSNLISCNEFLDCLTYNNSHTEFDGQSISDVLKSIREKKGNFELENSNVEYEDLEIYISEQLYVNSSQLVIDYQIIGKKKNQKCQVTRIDLDLWVSKFSLMGSYIFENFSPSVLEKKDTITGSLHVNEMKVKNDILSSHIKESIEDISCVKTKLKSIKSNCSILISKP